MTRAAAALLGAGIVAALAVVVIPDEGAVPAEIPELPRLAIVAASVEFFGSPEPPRLSASLRAARALRSTAGDSGGTPTYRVALWLALHRTPAQAVGIALEAMPFGEECIGIGDAALRYMHVPARQLDAAQIAALVALAGSPEELAARREPWRARRDSLLLELRRNGALSDVQADDAMARPLLPDDWQVRPR